MFKLKNEAQGAWMHSHKVNYGSGSGQQSVTGFKDENDANSYWMVQAVDKTTHVARVHGAPIDRGDWVVVRHMATGHYLHSHNIGAPMSSGQGNLEISCYDHQDDGNFWEVLPRDSDHWERTQPVRLRHVSTQRYLAMTGNRYNNPIPGQLEVVGTQSPAAGALWETTLGIYFTDKPLEE